MPHPIDLAPHPASPVAGTGIRRTSAAPAAQPQPDTVQSILDTALLAEHLSAAFYYAGLTTAAILRTPQLGGSSGDPNDPGLPPGGNPHQVRYLQAALDADMKHATILVDNGAHAQLTRFYVPAGALHRLGAAAHADSFLGVLDQIETLAIGLYLAAISGFLSHGRTALAQLAGQLAGVDAEHRMLGRAIANLLPANNLTLEKEPFSRVGEAHAALRPFLTGRGFHGAARVIVVPTRQQAARVVGKYGTRRVHAFL